MAEILIDLDTLPSVTRDHLMHDVPNPREVVRCRDCIRATPRGQYLWCWCQGHMVKDDWFCATGERRHDEHQ